VGQNAEMMRALRSWLSFEHPASRETQPAIFTQSGMRI
jgi:hypothetical protein